MIKRFLAVLLSLLAFAAMAAVDVNKASQADLETISGIGPAISGKILDERKKGAFKDWQDLIDRVSCIGETNATKLSTGGLTVGGAAYKGAVAAPAAKKADAPKADAKPAKAAEPAASKPAKADKTAKAADTTASTPAKKDKAAKPTDEAASKPAKK